MKREKESIVGKEVSPPKRKGCGRTLIKEMGPFYQRIEDDRGPTLVALDKL